MYLQGATQRLDRTSRDSARPLKIIRDDRRSCNFAFAPVIRFFFSLVYFLLSEHRRLQLYLCEFRIDPGNNCSVVRECLKLEDRKIVWILLSGG